MKQFSRLLAVTMLLSMLLSVTSFAEISSFEGGVVGDPTLDDGTFEYEEMFFLSGKPIKLVGTVELPDAPKAGASTYSLSYTYELQNTAETVTLSRDVTYEVVEVVNESMQQTTYKADISSLDETITVGGTTYTLGSYLFDESQLIDNTPAVDYFNGNLYSKRKYFINGNQITNEGVATVEITSDNYIGYKHLWGDLETQVLLYDIRVDLPEAADATSSADWSGQVMLKMNTVTRKTFNYSSTDPQTISFRGNYVTTTTDENVLQYTYNLPTIADDGTVSESVRNKGEENLRSDMITDSNSLITSKLRDIGGHWAESSIYLLSSLEVFSADDMYFGPDLPVNRLDFAKAITKSIASVSPFTDQELIKRDRQRDREDLYLDIDSKDPDLAFVEFVKNKGLMAGEGDYFMPDRTLRRAEAISIMVNALGMSHLAPQPPYTTGYVDDTSIPSWARDSIYVASEIGLIDGFEDGTIRPDKVVTRAEAAVMLETFIRHIKDEISYDYREKIINRY